MITIIIIIMIMIIVINDQMQPIFATYFLHILQGHSSVTQFEILDLNVEWDFSSLYSFGKTFLILGPKLVKDSVP